MDETATLPDTPQQIRPLVIPRRFAADESLVGGVAASTRANVLGSTQVILREIGLGLAHPGTVGQELRDMADRLATKLGCDAKEVSARCHPYVGRDDGGPVVRYGAGTLRRCDLILDRRRISPISLSLWPHHRAAWSCRHLPYCEESLELLVDACGHCGKVLRWSQAWGIGVCEYCRCPVAAAAGNDRLDPLVVDGYRGFARLISFVAEIRERARTSLAPELARLTQPHLVDLVVGTGLALAEDGPAPGRRAARSLTPALHAAAVARGMGLITAWPAGLREAVAAKVTKVEENPSGRGRLLQALRSLGDERAFGADVAQVVRTAIPEAFEQKQRALGSLRRPVMLARDVRNAAGINSAQLAVLDKAGLLPSVKIAVGDRRQRQYDRVHVDVFALRRRRSEPATRLAGILGVPIYAIEQLACQGAVAWENLPAILLIEPELRLVTESAATFTEALNAALRTDTPPAQAVTLWSAMRRNGGGAKAWGSVLADAAHGLIPIWTKPCGGHRPFVRRAMVLPENVAHLPVSPIPAVEGTAMPLSTTMSKDDACELLNLDNLTIRPVIDARLLVFVHSGKALRTDKLAAAELASRLITAAEIAAVLNVRADAVWARMRSHPGVRPMPGGWSRSDFKRVRLAITDGAAPPSPSR